MILTILLVILGIALVVVFVNRGKDEEKARLAIIGLTSAIIVLAIVRLVGGGGGLGQATFKVDTTLEERIGEVLADRVVQAATGRRVVIVSDVRPSNPVSKARTEAFQVRLLSHNIELLGVESPWPKIEGRLPEEGLSAYAVVEALRQHPEAEVVVSLAGFPGHNLAEVERQLEKVEIFVFEDYVYFEWKPFLNRGVIDGIVMQPLDADWTDESGSAEEMFDQRYIFVTRQNFRELRDRFESSDFY